MNTASYKKNKPYGRMSATGLTNKRVVLRSSAAAEYSASVACVVELTRHHRDASAASRQSAILHDTRLYALITADILTWNVFFLYD